MGNRRLSAEGIAFLSQREGRHSRAYLDSAGLWTIGVGHLIKPDEEHLRTAELSDAEIDALLRQDVEIAERSVNANVQRRITQNQFDALVSFVFNVGAAAFAESTLLKLLNDRAQPAAISAQFKRWNQAGGKVVSGLVKRRNLEAALFWKHLGTLSMALLLTAGVLLIGAGIVIMTT